MPHSEVPNSVPQLHLDQRKGDLPRTTGIPHGPREGTDHNGREGFPGARLQLVYLPVQGLTLRQHHGPGCLPQASSVLSEKPCQSRPRSSVGKESEHTCGKTKGQSSLNRVSNASVTPLTSTSPFTGEEKMGHEQAISLVLTLPPAL